MALLISLGSDVYLDISDLRCMYRHSEIAGIILSPQISGGPGDPHVSPPPKGWATSWITTSFLLTMPEELGGRTS